MTTMNGKGQLHIEYWGQDLPYPDAVARQEAAVADVLNGGQEKLFMVEHAPLYTAGSSAIPADYLGYKDIPVYPSGRGGQYTYHGPGQRVAYPILDLRERGRDLRKYIHSLQEWLILTLADFGVEGYRRDEVGVWVDVQGQPHKIAAIGVRVRKWVTFHGIALNVCPDLSHFQGSDLRFHQSRT